MSDENRPALGETVIMAPHPDGMVQVPFGGRPYVAQPAGGNGEILAIPVLPLLTHDDVAGGQVDGGAASYIRSAGLYTNMIRVAKSYASRAGLDRLEEIQDAATAFRPHGDSGWLLPHRAAHAAHLLTGAVLLRLFGSLTPFSGISGEQADIALNERRFMAQGGFEARQGLVEQLAGSPIPLLMKVTMIDMLRMLEAGSMRSLPGSILSLMNQVGRFDAVGGDEAVGVVQACLIPPIYEWKASG